VNEFLLEICERCHLKDTRTRVVLPRGNNFTAEIMFIGEAPGRQEDKEGRPFVGQAGKWFDAAMEVLNLNANEYYLTNTVKCRPVTEEGGNRPPTDQEIQICGYWLKQEIEMLNPKLIVLMGGTALKAFFKNTKISNVAGEEVLGHKLSKTKGIRIFVLYHPAVLIYNKNFYYPLYKRGLAQLKKIVDEIIVPF